MHFSDFSILQHAVFILPVFLELPIAVWSYLHILPFKRLKGQLQSDKALQSRKRTCDRIPCIMTLCRADMWTPAELRMAEDPWRASLEVNPYSPVFCL